jgi:serine/threonine protein kinase/Tfp pilus assembly protein PilF
MIGQTISHYRILEKLGEGGMGVVYKAEDTKLHRPVALKVLPRQALITEEDKIRFAREAQAAASLSHPNIAIIHEFDEVDDPVTGGKLAFIAMEYVDGETVKQKIKPVGAIHESPLPLDELLKIAIATAEGLAEAHGKGIVHRDIKSENVMISRSGVVKIMDFGLAEIAGRSRVTKEGMTVGTVAYMSPEQALGEKLDQRTDIWSLGVVMYEMITGRLPFTGDYEQAVVYRILNEEPEPITSLRSNVPMELERIVKKAMQKDPAVRYQTVGDLAADLKSLKKQLESGARAATPSPEIRPTKKRVYLYTTIAALVVALVLALYYFIPKESKAINSIAVLPLKNLSGDGEHEYFAEGIHEELIAQLAKISALKVISRTSVIRYKNVQKPLPEIGRELGAEALIEGSVRRSGDQVRITVQLIEAATDKHLWAESYQRDLRDVLALQSDVARAIANEIRITLTAQEQAGLTGARPVNPRAYEAYLKGRFYWNKRTPASLMKGIEYFNQAIEQDPSDPLAYAGLADSYNQLAYRGHLPPNEAYARARAAVTKALDINSGLAEAHASLGFIHLNYEWDWAAAEQELRRAIELNPGYAEAHHWYSHYLMDVGRVEESLAESKRALELDPLSLIVSTHLGWHYVFARQYDSAIVQLKKTLEMDPNYYPAHLHLGRAYQLKGNFKEALVELQQAVSLSQNNTESVAALAATHASSGRPDEAMKLLRELEQQSHRNYVSSYDIAVIYTALGNRNEALASLAKAYEQRANGLVEIKAEPAFDPLRSDRRFQDLVQRMNFPDANLPGRR